MPTDLSTAERAFRPVHPPRVRLSDIARAVPALSVTDDAVVSGVCLDSRAVQAGDLYIGLPGARAHGATFSDAAAAAGAAAILTDDEGLAAAAATGLPVVSTTSVRAVIGDVSACVFGTQSDAPALFGVTGTNGKTTTTYFLRSLLNALGRSTGLIGTIEIVAGQTPIPSVLTTPEATQLHALLARMRDGGIDATAMEVSSHALDYGRVAGLRYAVAGFTQLTQDHLDLHGTMEEYFASKARLFEPETSRAAVVTVDDAWGRLLAARRRETGSHVLTLATRDDGAEADWTVTDVAAHGLGHEFTLRNATGDAVSARVGLPGDFNVSNAALALTMILASGIGVAALQQALDEQDPLSVAVPGRMQVISHRPAAVVDFAHNADALQRAIAAVRPASGRVITVFGATGDRDATKRPVMGAVAAECSDVVIITDDDPHSEDPAAIRSDVLAGARQAVTDQSLTTAVIEASPRAAAIRHAVQLATEEDTILVAGRGHETVQDVAGVDHALDDRTELSAALVAAGFTPIASNETSTTASEADGQRGEGVKSS
ncbi:UDP-N-acetylmuramoyl-L-alanyl-D-glutamate--2,6-diaminopimelate ligase [Zhihengliuella flava]|uniref:UDP-N-acetylmuramyl-tripeptide synthetase n=1 Tax=Zhihengliuella flava TaxID=1285193 RepID=A0A931DF43_9MICC|nr:UDP-N-acetylmuramoyl-L-alanyl-D-glutamate--2,6-diaminopimelate ligase [Zhihengliuella flava]MBG6085628.1 UDP-N-acetylmuramoyl-L-alanyl-D-glutamate--2,6-diaminopimelate ligase [Zhihengliuella flava]